MFQLNFMAVALFDDLHHELGVCWSKQVDLLGFLLEVSEVEFFRPIGFLLIPLIYFALQNQKKKGFFSFLELKPGKPFFDKKMLQHPKIGHGSWAISHRKKDLMMMVSLKHPFLLGVSSCFVWNLKLETKKPIKTQESWNWGKTWSSIKT